MVFQLKLASLMITCMLLMAISAHAERRFYVSVNGNDQWSGKRPGKSGKDGPFATLERARDEIRGERKSGELEKTTAVTVIVEGGRYRRTKAFRLTGEDGGAKGAPVIYKAASGQPVVFTGSVSLPSSETVTDPEILDRMGSGAASHIRKVDLKAAGLTDYGVLSRKGFVGEGEVQPVELYLNDRRMTLARWPNNGTWARIGTVPASSDGQVFGYKEDRPARWKDLSDAWVYGYWTFDWADSFQKIKSIDGEKRLITTEPPSAPFGYTAGKRYLYLNLLEELDSPGEYYIDRKKGVLYFWPPEEGGTGGHNDFLTTLTEPLVQLEEVHDITLEGFVLDGARGDGIVISRGENCLIAGCTLRNLGRSGIRITDSKRSGVQSCDLYDLGENGIILQGGDRQKLVSGELFAINNHIHHFSLVCRTYRPAISLEGVGCHIAHNCIYDAPHTAIQGGGNDHLIEYNEIYRVCQETGDAGAFYMGRDFTQRGNVVRYNYFHDLRAGSLSGEEGFTDVMGVYLDDCFSGTTVLGNVFEKAGRSAMIGGGRDNTIENNIFIEGTPAIHVDSRGKGWAAKYFVKGGEWSIFEHVEEMHVSEPPYSTHYPKLANILQDDPAMAKGNRILRNVCVGGKWIELQDGMNEQTIEFKDNYIGNDPGFVSLKAHDFRLKPDAAILKLGFKPLPFDQMGLQRDVYRTKLKLRKRVFSGF